MARTQINDNWIRTIVCHDGEKYTFCGALEYRYGHIAAYWNNETRRQYGREYNDIILPALKNHNEKGIDEYTKEDYESAINRIRENGFVRNGVKYQYAESTLHHFRNLIYVVVFHSSVYNLCENVLRDTSFVIDALGEEQEKESRVRIKKSLNTEQETSLFSELLLDPNEEGSYIALLLMWGLGLRNAEACGLNYGDLKPIEGHPDCYAAWIYKTTKIDSNELQAGGKTYNTGRIVPVPDKIVSFLSIRERQIQALISEQGINANIEELPICCAGYIERESDAYLTRCKSGDVTKASHIVFDKAGISSEQVAYLDIELSEGNTAAILKEKDPTAYLLRRNYATHMSILGLTNAEMQYLMGHNVEDAYESRNEFVDSERIYEMHRKLSNRPLLNHSISNDNTDRIFIPKRSTMRIHASALEPTDAVTVRIETNSPEMVQSKCFESAHPGEYARTVNNLEQYSSGYQSSAGKI